MKITEIETFVVDAGWRPWQFTAVRTDEGITGYGTIVRVEGKRWWQGAE